MTTALDRGRILAQAGDLFLAKGPGGVTMRGLAARMGVTPMALYRHFDNRDDLMRSLHEEGHAVFLAYLNRSLAEPTPARRLLESGHQYLAFALDHPRNYAVMFMEAVPCETRDGAPQHWLDAATFRFLVDRIRDCDAAGDLSVRNPEAVALAVWAQVHGLVSLYLAGKLEVDRAAFEGMYAASIRGVMRAFGWKDDEGAA